jgi:histidine triad (HIT) family protein
MASVFTRIRNREIPSRIFYETDQVMVIADHRPKDRVHLLVIPKEEHRNFYHAPPEILAEMNQTVKIVVEKLGISNGYGQEVDHIHYHILSDRGADKLTWLE